MKTYLTLVFILSLTFSFSQKETTWWPAGDHVFLDFSTNPTGVDFSSNTYIFQYSSSVSDKNGNLLFYTNGEEIFGKNNQLLPNCYSVFPPNKEGLTNLMLKKPGNNSHYYFLRLLSNPEFSQLQCVVLDTLANNLIGDAIGAVSYDKGTFALKMDATKHCNNKDFWVVIVRYPYIDPSYVEFWQLAYDRHKVEFWSYLVTENGVQPQPIKSYMQLETILPFYGQLKFNSKGNVLACADPNGIHLFDFDKQTGKVNYKKRYNLQLNNGWGIEFSSDDSKLYINEKQFDFQTEILTDLLGYDSPCDLQRALDGAIYKRHFPEWATTCCSLPFDDNHNSSFSGNLNNPLRISKIHFPNNQGVSCQFDSTFIYQEYTNENNWMSFGLPNFPSYHFYHPKSEFNYSKACENDSTYFFLSNSNNQIDSTKWLFSDKEITGDSVSYYFASSGTYEVGCIAFSNGTSDTSFQCISICGKNDVELPKTLELCDTTFLVNAMNTCSLEYEWNTGDTTSAIKIDTEGLYILKTTNYCGIYYDTINVISCQPVFEIPNVFTPNNDGINDDFSINLKNIKSITCNIINRWGNTVSFKTLDLSNEMFSVNNVIIWDGLDNNQVKCTDGVYFYKIYFISSEDKQFTQSGFIQLFGQ
jgi:gliding motility-associated-like protein